MKEQLATFGILRRVGAWHSAESREETNLAERLLIIDIQSEVEKLEATINYYLEREANGELTPADRIALAAARFDALAFFEALGILAQGGEGSEVLEAFEMLN